MTTADRPPVRTGDVGRLDADGYLYVMDRKKDVIISGGLNVFPRAVAEVIAAHPDVADVAVIGAPYSGAVRAGTAP